MGKVFVLSDGTGRTAEQILNAAMTQFESAEVEIIRRPAIRSERNVREAVDEARRAGAFIVHTLVSDELRGLILRAARKKNVETIDLMGPLLARLSHHFAVDPSEKPGLFAQLHRDYFRRIETMDFAFRHDDGQRVEDLRLAEIVLLGVSRTFKTPLSIYLAFKGWLVANIPVVMGSELPRRLSRLPARRVFCLNTNPRELAQLRQARHDHLKGETGEYSSFEHVRLELMYAREIYHRHPRWAIVEVTRKPIEEIASEILSLRGKRK